MQKENKDESQFRITVNGKTYNVTAQSQNLNSYFEIETDCEYLFTVSMGRGRILACRKRYSCVR